MKPPSPPVQPPIIGGPVVLDRDSAVRMGEATVYVEQMRRNKAPDQRRRGGGGSSVRIMVVTTTIAAMSGSTVGTGQAKDMKFNNSTKALTVGTGSAVGVCNYHEKTFVSGAIIAVYPWSDTLWAFDVDKCANYA